MADKKISQLTGATTPLAGTEVLPIVQGGNTVNVSVNNLTAGKSVSATNFTPTGSTVPANGMYLRTTNVLGFATNSAQAVDIDASGNVGVNITNQADHGKFVVNNAGGNATSGLTVLSNDQSTARLRLFNYGSSGRDFSFVAGNPGADNSGLSLYDNTNTRNVLRLDNSDNFSVSRGNLVIGTAGKGIDFSANTNAAGMTSELLNYYEEGAWTPTVTSATGVITLVDTLASYYTRVGRLVHVYVSFGMTTNASVGTSNITIGGLPFAAVGRGFGNFVYNNYSASDYGTGGAHGLVFVDGSAISHVARSVDISSRSSTFYWGYSATYTTS